MNPIKTAAALAALLLAAPAAWAQPQPRPAHTRPARTRARSQPRRHAKSYDFTGDHLDAHRVAPDGTTIFGLRSARHSNLIHLRGDFLSEIVRSAESID